MNLIYNTIKILLIFVINNYYNVIGQRVAPGVNPQQYQQQGYQQPPQQPYQQAPEYQQYQQQPQYGERIPPGVPAQHYQQDQYNMQQQPQQGHYQQQPQQQPQQGHYQQQPQQQPQQGHYQQQPQQQQPQQGQHQQQPQQGHHQQQQPQAGGHGHHHAQGQQVLNAANVQHEREHIAEHMDVPIDTSNMSEQELQFHYFKMHDSDQNNMLDGCELIKSLIHWHDDGNEGSGNFNENLSDRSDEALMEIIDSLLTSSDVNNDEADDGKLENKENDSAVRDDETLKNMIDPIMELMDTNRDGFISYEEYRTSEHAKP